MGMLITILFCVRNYILAGKKGLSGGKWAFYTFLAVLAGWFIGSFIMVMILMIRYPEMISLASQPDLGREEITAFLMEHMDPMVADVFMLFCGLGGYLFVNYRLKKSENQNNSATE